jgi:muramoyltetrapeptide carboxypeptidase
MITPSFLKTGDKIAIVAPGKYITAERIDNAVKILSSWNLKVTIGKNVLGKNHYFSASDKERLVDFQNALDNRDIKAIFCARGGYGTSRIIDDLDFTTFRDTPKWIIGYSDITVLHSHINSNFGIETLHAPMPLDYAPFGEKDPGLDYLKEILFGSLPKYVFPVKGFRIKSQRGVLVGGNLSVIHNLNDTPSALKTEGCVLFLEEVGEKKYAIDRMLWNLKRSGRLNNLKGLILGHFSKVSDGDGENAFYHSVETMVRHLTEKEDYPVIFGFPAGHEKNNYPLIMGRNILIHQENENMILEFEPPVSFSENQHIIKKIFTSAISILILFGFIYFIYYLLFKYLI